MADPAIISVFNNKGGVGKTTLTFHLAHALAEMGIKTLLIDLDPQSNLTISSLSADHMESLWSAEDDFIESFDDGRTAASPEQLSALNSTPRTIHYILKPTEDGTGELAQLPPPIALTPNLHLIPGRLTLHMYEEKIASRWSDLFRRDPLAIRTVMRLRTIALEYAKTYGHEVILVDTSPSLGSLNKVAISTADGFLIPCLPDMFSLYGIRNIGRSLNDWIGQFDIVSSLLLEDKRRGFREQSVRFLGFTIYNAKKYAGSTPWNLAKAHYNHAQRIPHTIRTFIPVSVRGSMPDPLLSAPIGGQAVMHTHNTLPSMAQKYRCPIWLVPSANIDPTDRATVAGNRATYEATQEAYKSFARDLLQRLHQATPSP